jgi:hypothetical protein
VSGGIAIAAGDAVCVDTTNAGDVVKCPANATSGIIGVAADAISAGGSGDIVLLGEVTNAVSAAGCTVGNWVVVYTTAGEMSCTGTFTGGAVVGIALSTGGATMLVQPR